METSQFNSLYKTPGIPAENYDNRTTACHRLAAGIKDTQNRFCQIKQISEIWKKLKSSFAFDVAGDTAECLFHPSGFAIVVLRTVQNLSILEKYSKSGVSLLNKTYNTY